MLTAELVCSFDGTSSCGYSKTSSHAVMDVGWMRTSRNDTTVTIQDGDTTETIKDSKFKDFFFV